MSRKDARETVFKLVFEFTLNEQENELTLNDLLSEKEVEGEQEYIVSTYKGIIENYNALCEKIAKYSNGFALNRIYKIDLAILCLAVYELEHTDIPHAVVINEAVNIAKKYSTEKSAPFINGILANMVKDGK